MLGGNTWNRKPLRFTTMLLTLLLLLAVVLTIPVTGFTNTTQTPDVSSFLRTAFTNLGSAWPENTWQWADAVSNVAGSINGSHLFDGPWTRLKQATTNRTRDSYPPWLQQAADQWAVESAAGWRSTSISPMDNTTSNTHKLSTNEPGGFLGLAHHLLDAQQGVRAAYTTYWQSIYSQHLALVADLRSLLDSDSSGGSDGLMGEMVSLLREATGAQCTPPAFTPPTRQPALIVGRGLNFVHRSGGCTLTRSATEAQRDLVMQCTLPSTTLTNTQPHYLSAYVAPASFRGTACRRELVQRGQVTTTINLWDPGQAGWRVTAGARAGNSTRGAPFLTIDSPLLRQRVDMIREVLSSQAPDLTANLTRKPGAVARAHAQMREALRAAGLQVEVEVGDSAARATDPLQGMTGGDRPRWGGVHRARADLSALLPGSTMWSLGEGVANIFDEVLQRGLAATLRASTAPHAGTGTNSTGNTSSASSASADFMPHASSADDLPHDLFHRLAQEMGRILSVRAQAQAASQSTSSSSSCEGGSSGRVPRGRGAQQRRMTVPPAAHVAMLWAAQRVVQAAGAVLVKAATLDGDGGVVGGE